MSKYSYCELLEYCKKHKIRTPVADLITYGVRCNWLKRNRQPFKSLSSFVNYYNSVWIKKNGNSDKGYWASNWGKKEFNSKFKSNLKQMAIERKNWKSRLSYILEDE